MKIRTFKQINVKVSRSGNTVPFLQLFSCRYSTHTHTHRQPSKKPTWDPVVPFSFRSWVKLRLTTWEWGLSTPFLSALLWRFHRGRWQASWTGTTKATCPYWSKIWESDDVLAGRRKAKPGSWAHRIHCGPPAGHPPGRLAQRHSGSQQQRVGGERSPFPVPLPHFFLFVNPP